jgi:hypothetical protein
MKKIYFFILCVFILSCAPKKEKLTSKIYVLKEIQEANHPDSLHKFPIIAELPATEEIILPFNLELDKKNNFDEYAKGCFEPELGLRIIEPNQSIKVILVSIRCARIYIYQNNKKEEYILSQLGKNNFRKLFSKNFPEYEHLILP